MMRALAIASVSLVIAGLLVYSMASSPPEQTQATPPQRSAADAPPSPASSEPTEASGKSPTTAATSLPRDSTAPAVPGSKTAEPGAKDVTFDDVKLELKKGDPYDSSLLTDKVKKLDGKSIRIRGYILPSFQQSNIKQFVLVRDNMECCFGPGALLHDCIIVEMTPPATASFTVRPVSVEGVFSIRELKLDGKYLAIYHLDGKDVK
jgi:hypothetical protein